MLDAEEAYQQYRDMVYGYLIRLCRDRDLAEELTQETFYQAMKKLEAVRRKKFGRHMALRDCTESVSARHAEAVAAAIGQRAGGVRPGFHGDGRGTQSRPECASSSPPSAGTVSRGVHPENLLRIVQ